METQGHERLMPMKPLSTTLTRLLAAHKVRHMRTYACKQQTAYTATHSPCPAFAWARARCIAISAAFPRCKSAWVGLERFVGLAKNAPFLHSTTARITYAHTLCSHFVWFASTFSPRSKCRHIGSA